MGEVVSTLFLVIKSIFLSIMLNQIIHDMRSGVLEQYRWWISRKVEGQCTTMVFDWYMLVAQSLPRGLDQGCLLSGITFQFYNADLLEVSDKKKGWGCHGLDQ